MDDYFDKMLKEYDEKQNRLLSAKWAIGFKDRGHGHGDYGVITENKELIVECPGREIAEHIIKVHNKNLE